MLHEDYRLLSPPLGNDYALVRKILEQLILICTNAKEIIFFFDLKRFHRWVAGAFSIDELRLFYECLIADAIETLVCLLVDIAGCETSVPQFLRRRDVMRIGSADEMQKLFIETKQSPQGSELI